MLSWTSVLKDCRPQSSLKQALRKPLEVSAFRLQGHWSALPEQLRNFLNLEVLVLKGNGLTALPSWLNQLPKLRALELSNLQIRELPDLRGLEELEISFADNIPSGISRLSGLRRLSLNYCPDATPLEPLPTQLLVLELNSVHFTQLPSLPEQLEKLTLRQTQIAQLPKLAQLRELVVRLNSLEELPTLPSSLEVLELSSTGIAVGSLPDMPNLRDLDLSFTPSPFPERIERFPQLERLFMVECGLEELPEQIVSLEKLHWLNLNVNRLRQLPVGLNRLPNLVLLHLKANHLQSIPDFSQTPSLTDVMLGGNPLPVEQLESHFPADCKVDSDDAGFTISREDLHQRLGAHFGLQAQLVPLRVPPGWTIFANDFCETLQTGDNRELFRAGHLTRIVRLEAWDGVYQLSLEHLGEDELSVLATFHFGDWQAAQNGLNSALQGTLPLPKTGLPD